MTALASAAAPSAYSLDDRYRLAEGEVFLSGVQALVRMLLDQRRADMAAGLHTAVLTSGYQGSPLGGLDREIAGLGELAAEYDLVHRPGVNEELGATAVSGSQLLDEIPGRRYDGVVGVWYGKAPGVDRACDALRHANYVGSHPRGGAIALCGDDPECKSSTVPSASEATLASLEIPVFYPGSVQEVLDLGRHAIACARASGLWSAVKIHTAVADATATALAGAGRVTPQMPVLEWEGGPYVHRPSGRLLSADALAIERTLRGVRTDLARLYGRMNGLNRIEREERATGLGIVASGPVYHRLIGALSDLGVPRPRILRLGMIHPLDEEIVREFAGGLREVLVLEEKGPFLERAIKDALYGAAAPPLVTGRRDDTGAPLVSTSGALTPERLTRAVAARLLAHDDLPSVSERVAQLDAIAARPAVDVGQTRVPHFCSGCPHSISTRVEEGVTVGGGIGCHTMVLLSSGGRGDVLGVTQMGGEGCQFIGVAPFVEPRHFVQNLGDGTFHHSGSLAIRAAIAAGLDVTYKLLYNSTVAMTGGQAPVGQMSVAEIATSLATEGVTRIIVTTEDPERYRDAALPAIAEVRGRTALAAAQRELADVAGVTVLIHDQACATELRRERKRGRAPDPAWRMMINERVCEGCGDCGSKSSCLSLEPVETEFGRKTRIDTTSCNKDAACLEGDCPSFLRVIPPKDAKPQEAKAKSAARRPAPPSLPEPVCELDEVAIRMVGIGGTGVVTVSQVLSVAAMLDGRHAAGLDQTGLSQKAGPVVSDVRLGRQPLDGGVHIGGGGTDVLLGLDVLGTATARNLQTADADRTTAIVSTTLAPTAEMVTDVHAAAPDLGAARAAIDAVTRAQRNVYLDARAIAIGLVGTAQVANVVVLGAAWQRGLVPLSHDALVRAFELNGVAVKANLAAFEWGRAAAAQPEAVQAALAGDGDGAPQLSSAQHALVEEVAPFEGELRRRVAIRVADLAGWGGPRAAARYARAVADVRALESERLPGSTAVAEAYASGLHKLMAYKDEYEVARLHLDALRDLPDGSRVTFMLHPPVLRALGMERKLALGPWFQPAFRMLRAGRRLRGTALDPFGRAEVRRVERALPDEYTALVRRGLEHVTTETADALVELAESPDMVRGYEQIKLDNVARYRAAAQQTLARLVG